MSKYYHVATENLETDDGLMVKVNIVGYMTPEEYATFVKDRKNFEVKH